MNWQAKVWPYWIRARAAKLDETGVFVKVNPSDAFSKILKPNELRKEFEKFKALKTL